MDTPPLIGTKRVVFLIIESAWEERMSLLKHVNNTHWASLLPLPAKWERAERNNLITKMSNCNIVWNEQCLFSLFPFVFRTNGQPAGHSWRRRWRTKNRKNFAYISVAWYRTDGRKQLQPVEPLHYVVAHLLLLLPMVAVVAGMGLTNEIMKEFNLSILRFPLAHFS